MNELIKEAYIQSQCQVLGCSKTQYLHDIAMAQIDKTTSFVFIFGGLAVLGIVLLILGIVFTKKKCEEAAFASYIVGALLIVFMGVACLMNLSNYIAFIDNPDMAALHWIDVHISICGN